MTAVLFDTNACLRFLLNDIPQQADKVASLIQKAKRKDVKIFISQITIFEIHFSLEKYYKLEKTDIVEKLESIVAAPYFSVQDREIFKRAIALWREKNIDFVDCFLIYKARKRDIQLFSFDKKLIFLYKQQSRVSNGAGKSVLK